MSASRRRGFTRLALAVGVPYFGWWAFYGWMGYNAIPRYLAEEEKARAAGDWSSSSMWMRMVNDANDAFNLSLLWGVVVPIAALIVGGLAYWVYRGFKPKAPPA